MAKAIQVQVESLEFGPQPRPAGDSRRRADLPVVVPLGELQATDPRLVGAKAANLARLRQADFAVPDGFCVTTGVYVALTQSSDFAELRERLALADASDANTLAAFASELRDYIRARSLPPAAHRAIVKALEATGRDRAYAVRSSATAEDLPNASFAGQHETVLNVRGEQPVIEAIQACLASLYTERAVRYRAQRRIPDDGVTMAVLVQEMIEPVASGVAFSADPASGNRHVAVIEAVLGLGEAQVSGKVTPDRVRVDRQRGQILDYTVGDQGMVVESRPAGGIRTAPLVDRPRLASVLSNEQILAFAGTPRCSRTGIGWPAGRRMGARRRPVCPPAVSSHHDAVSVAVPATRGR